MKKLFTLFLALVASVGMMKGEIISGIYNYSLEWSINTEDSTLTIDQAYSYTTSMVDWNSASATPWYIYRNNIRHVNISNKFTSIGKYAFYGCDSLQSVTIPSSVYEVRQSAFQNCQSLKSVTFLYPSRILEYAFANCTSLDTISAYQGIYSINNSAFEGCTALKGLNIPQKLTTIGGYAFKNCTSLATVTLPSSLTTIGNNAFYNCSKLSLLSIPNSVNTIGENAFNGIRYISYSGNATGSPWGALYVNVYEDGSFVYSDENKTTLVGCSDELTGDIQIPDNVTAIGDYAFRYRSDITSIEIPNSVTSIGKSSFSGCTGLTSIEIPNSVTSIGNSSFSGCTGLTSIEIPNSVTSIGNSSFSGCTGLTSIEIPNSVTSIGISAFSGCTGLVSITIGTGLQTVGMHAFSNCNALTEVHISDLAAWCNVAFELSNIGQTHQANPIFYAKHLYLNNIEVTDLVIPEGVTSIGGCAFYGCQGITSVSIPNSVTKIGSCAFSGCSSLTEVHISDLAAWCNISFGDNPLSIAKHLFLNDIEITNLVIPEGVTSISNSAFGNWTGLISVTLPESLASIGSSAFSGCTGLTSITLPESLTSIGDNAFSGCTNISGELIIPNSVNSIGSSAFYGCNLSKVTINSNALVSKAHTVNTNNNFWKIFGDQELEFILGDSIKSIGAYAFWGSRMTKISMPAGIKSISNFAFNSCRNITTITIPDSTTYIGEYAFATCQKLSTVKLGKSIASMGTRALGYGLKCLEITNPTPPDSIRVSACGATPTSCELLVPEDILEAYKNAPFWRNFYIINIIRGDHTVIFKDWNGNELSRVQVPDGGSAVDLAPTAPEVEHNVFIGWSQDLSNITESMTVYAQYEPIKVLVQFVDWDGTVLKSDSVYYQGWVEAPDNPYRRGYYFIGWDRTFTWEDLVTDLVITALYEALPEGSAFVREDGGIHALFSVSEGKQVLFSRGNLQFNAAQGSHACADGSTQPGTWRFAPEQYNIRQWENYNRGAEYDNWIDLFYYGTSGYNGNMPYRDEIDAETLSQVGYCAGTYYDYGVYNAISNGGNQPGEWRMFTQAEWRYVTAQRPHAYKLRCIAKIPQEYDYIYGLILLPDDGDTTLIYKEIDYNDPEAYLNYDPSVPSYSLAEWRQLEAKGAIFLPAAGNCTKSNGNISVNYYYSGDYMIPYNPTAGQTYLSGVGFDTTSVNGSFFTGSEGISVRLVKDAPISHLNAVANNSSYGSISGETIYFGEDITITATPNEGYHFVQWSDGITDNPRTFTLTGDSIITAEFAPNTYTLNVSCDEEQGTIEGESGSFDYLSEHVLTANAHYGYTFDKWSDGVTENPRTLLLTHDTTITAIFNINHYPIMFLNWNGERLSSQSVAYNHAAEAPQLPEREGYIFMGWTADIEHIIDTTFAIALYDKVGVEVTYKAEDGETIFSEHADLHLPAAPIIAGKSFKGWLTESADSENGIVLRATYTFDNPTTHDDVTITPSSNSAYVIFPFITGALTYQLVIRDLFGNVVCKIMFSATGHLLGIAFAPSRNRESQQATQTTGFNFTVEGLDANTTYEYEFVANDDTDEVIETLSGSFTTTAEVPTDNEQVNSPSAIRKYLEDGHLLIDTNSHIFDAQGKRVR